MKEPSRVHQTPESKPWPRRFGKDTPAVRAGSRSGRFLSSVLIAIRSTIFQTQIDFIQKSGIVTAIGRTINAPTGTRL